MTMYEIINLWNHDGESVNAKCAFSEALHYAIVAAKELRRSTMDYHLARLYGMIDMYNAMLPYDDREKRWFKREEREKITRLVNRIYYRTWKLSDECRIIETA